jgi:hypothetical protein
MTAAPLPRSLAPLPQESMPGFLLRLAHRLQVSPLQVAVRAGLSSDLDHKAVPASVLVSLPDETTTAFARATRLTPAEVSDLTLISLAPRYPWLDPDIMRRPHTRRRGGISLRDRWVFTRFTRYCPDCLRGDDSLIQRRHGGAWRKTWRLPVVFACPTHQRLFAHTCPACGALALARPASQARPVPMVGHPVTHPAACRNHDPARPDTPCGHRLDTATEHRPPARVDPRLLQVQQRLLDLLDGHAAAPPSLGHPATPSQYLIDLRITAGLLQVGWPAAHDQTDATDADLLDQHVTSSRRHADPGRWPMRCYDTPPADARTGAAVLATAAQILTAGPDTVRALAQAAFRALPSSAEWAKSFLPGDGYCSPQLGEVVGAEARSAHVMKRLGIPPRPVQPQPRPVRFQARHIPQYLPQAWHDQYFADLVDIDPCWVRRAVPILLIRICAGGSVRRAGPRIGLPRNAGRHAIDLLTTWTHRVRQRHAAFDAALAGLIEELNTASDLTDYGRRRAALETWQLPAEQWDPLVADLIDAPVNGRHPAHTDWADTKRLLASVWIWTSVTSGECDFAPILFPPVPGRRPGGQLSVYVHRRWPAITAASGHYQQLRPRLDTIADAVAERIDAGGQP